MKKWTLNFLLMAIISCVSFSCNRSKSLQELLQEERKAIERFILTNNIKLVESYPQDHAFKENEYYKTAEGLFMQVVDSGNGTMVKPNNDVSLRFEYLQYIKNVVQGDTTRYYSYNPRQPFSFVYFSRNSYIPDLNNVYDVSQAWVIPLSYVGEGAIVNLIVPSSIGSSGDNSEIRPVFFRNLHYTRFN